MRLLLAACFSMLVACAPVITVRGESPAERLYDQATQYLSLRYYGYSSANLSDLIAQGRAELKKACLSLASGCGFEQAQAILRALIERLGDEHTYYLTPDQFQVRQRAVFGLGSGVPQFGFSSVYREASRSRLITDVSPNMPASEAGLTRGDSITAIEGQPLPVGALESRTVLTDAAKTPKPVAVTVRRAGTPRTVILTARTSSAVPLPSLRPAPEGVMVIRIPTFEAPKVALEVHALVRQAVQHNVKGIVLDLRDNPGGLITQCIGTVGALTQPFQVTSAERDSKEVYTYSQSGLMVQVFGLPINLIPISDRPEFAGRVVVLVNKNTASCGEIAAAGLQLRRAQVIGEATFGVLNTGTLSYGLEDGGAITISTTRTLGPDGQAFPDRVMPDIGELDDLDVLEREFRDVMLERGVRIALGRDLAMEK